MAGRATSATLWGIRCVQRGSTCTRTLNASVGEPCVLARDQDLPDGPLEKGTNDTSESFGRVACAKLRLLSAESPRRTADNEVAFNPINGRGRIFVDLR